MERHILITGAVGAGKSTLVRRLLQVCSLSRRGFRTWASDRDGHGYRSFFLSPAAEIEAFGTAENCIGRADGVKKVSFPEVFDRLGPPLLAARPGDVIVMDELGSMEEEALVFREAVMACLDGDVPVLGAVKQRSDLPFLCAVRNHPRVRLIEIDPASREEAFERLRPVVLRWNEEARTCGIPEYGP